MAGRHPKLTEDVQAKILQAIATGATRRTAAAFAGIGERTLYTWLASDRSPFRQFRQALLLAEANATILMIGAVRNAASTSWQAAAWWLERKYPDEWGKKDRIEFSELIRASAEKLAEETGLSVYDIIKESEAIARSG
jgi:transposase